MTPTVTSSFCSRRFVSTFWYESTSSVMLLTTTGPWRGQMVATASFPAMMFAAVSAAGAAAAAAAAASAAAAAWEPRARGAALEVDRNRFTSQPVSNPVSPTTLWRRAAQHLSADKADESIGQKRTRA